MMDNIFFKPNPKMVKWLIEYADGRLIIDVGCGQKMHLLNMLQGLGCNRIMGIEPHLDYQAYMAQRMASIPDNRELLQVMPRSVEESFTMLEGLGDKALLVFARPCHGMYLSNTLDQGFDSEVLYITMEENFNKYDDLGTHKDRAVLVDHEGVSEDNEKVWSIKPNE